MQTNTDVNPDKPPLAGIRVLDLSRILAGPWASTLLSDLGADVIKVERPESGDDTRSWGPPFVTGNNGRETRESAYFMFVNRAKRSLTVDIKTPGGQAIIRKLAAESDIVLENYKVGTLSRLGLGYEDLQLINPGLIYCSITGFGQDGPRSAQAAYDFAIQAMGGLMSVTGERDGMPGGGPQKVGVPIVDLATGLYAAVAVLASLNRRTTSGRGDYIDLAMLDVQVSMLANQAMNYFVSGAVPRRTGNAHPNIQPQDVYACSDGDLALAVGNDAQFAALCRVIGEDQLSLDERFRRNRDRVSNRSDLDPIIVGRLALQTRQYWADRLDQAGVPCAPINAIDEVFADRQVIYRNMKLELAHVEIGSVPAVASPMRFTHAPLDIRTAGPVLGQHTDEILQEIGYSADEISTLRASSAILLGENTSASEHRYRQTAGEPEMVTKSAVHLAGHKHRFDLFLISGNVVPSAGTQN